MVVHHSQSTPNWLPKMKNNKLSILLFFFLLFTSCDHRSTTFDVIQTETDLDYYTIEVFDDKLYVAGGDVWKQSDLTTTTNGIDWNTEYFTNRAIFDLHATDTNLLAVGTSGYLFSGTQEFIKKDMATTNLFKSITDTNVGYVAIAGKDFNKGWIHPLDSDYQILNEFRYDNELTDVKCDQNGYCIATGYGIILYSIDQGITWDRSSQDGDFYNSVGFNSENIPYIIGYNGSILYSNDNGIIWSAIKNAHSPLANNKPFRKIKFYNDTGFIVGDNGTIWKSEDDGRSWSDLSIKTELDLIDFVLFKNKLFIASEKGKIVTIDL